MKPQPAVTPDPKYDLASSRRFIAYVRKLRTDPKIEVCYICNRRPVAYFLTGKCEHCSQNDG